MATTRVDGMTVGQIKQAVRERDGMACTQCGISNEEHKAKTGRAVHVHRVVQGSEYSTAPGVCVTICRNCHDKISRKIRTRAEIASEYVRPPPPQRPTGVAEVLAARLGGGRARLKWTLKEAAERSGVHYVTISKYESGTKLPTLDLLYKLADAYGVECSAMIPPNAVGLLPKKRPTKGGNS
jgi:DNA-binding XRE family transcriptional regulator